MNLIYQSDTYDSLLNSLDGTRVDWPFSADLQDVQNKLFTPGISEFDQATELRRWVRGHSTQHCNFGQAAAKGMHVCIISEEDLFNGELYVARKIQKSRARWKGMAEDGESLAFLIAVISKSFAYSEPNQICKKLVLKVCDAYLGTSATDTPFADTVRLHLNKVDRTDESSTVLTRLLNLIELLRAAFGRKIYLKWSAPVTYLSAHADNRWWHTRRFPGGFALSVNSVGHLTTTLFVKNGMDRLTEENRLEALVAQSLPLAMTTVYSFWKNNDSTVRAMHSIELKDEPGAEVRCPRTNVESPLLRGFAHDKYLSYYNTDHVFPSDFFNTVIRAREFSEMPFDYIAHETGEFSEKERAILAKIIGSFRRDRL